MKTETIPIETARRIFINAQLLDGQTELSTGKKGLIEIFNRLGYIQIDSLSVINRTHHHVLWTRLPGYTQNMLFDLQEPDRSIFEYWAHALSFILMEDYRYFIPRMRYFETGHTTWSERRYDKCGHLLEPMLNAIREHGPMDSRQVAAFMEKDIQAKGMTPSQAIRVTLDLLFWKGDLVIKERKGFRKYFELPERVLPKEMDISIPTDGEMGNYFVNRALTALGIAQEKEIRTFMQAEVLRDAKARAESNKIVGSTLEQMKKNGEVVTVEIQGDDSGNYFIMKETLENGMNLKPTDKPVHMLSPFDNLIINRDRTRRIFDFDYTLECYVPAAKRKVGYFVLPVLWGERLVARFDPKAEKKEKVFYIRNLVFESWFDVYDEFLPAFADKLIELIRFNRCETVKVEKVSPKGIKTKVNRAIKEALKVSKKKLKN